MDKLNLLIADSTEEFVSALTASLQDSYRIHHCTNGKEALEYLIYCKPEIMVLDLMIPELDGISLLYKAVDAGICPTVLATTRLINTYVVEAAKNLNIGYVMLKPCDPQAAADRVRDLSRGIPMVYHSEEDPQSAVTNLLISLNVPTHLRGSSFLRESVLIMFQQPDISITKELYPSVASHFGANYGQVERSIRNAINQAWSNRADAVWAKYFHIGPDGRIPRPTNGIFISRLAEELRVQLDRSTAAVHSPDPLSEVSSPKTKFF